MVLAAPGTELLAWKPVASDLTQAPTPDVADLVDTLANRLGARPALSGGRTAWWGDVPERSLGSPGASCMPTKCASVLLVSLLPRC